MPLGGGRGEPQWEERAEAVPTPWMASENPNGRPPHGGDTQCWHTSDMLCLCRPISAAWTRILWQPPSKPLGAVPPTSARCGTPASMVWSSSSPTGMVSTQGGGEIRAPCPSGRIPLRLSLYPQSWWWLSPWLSSRSCCRCSQLSTVRSSSTWPSSPITSRWVKACVSFSGGERVAAMPHTWDSFAGADGAGKHPVADRRVL